MRKVISIVCSVVLCMSIVLASVGQVSALENADVANREEQISALFDEMTENLALSLLNEAIADESSVSSQAAVQEDLADIDEQLAELGVRQVEGDELAEILNRESVHSPVAPQASKPADTNTTKWYVYNYISNSYGGKKYDVQRLVAVGNNPGGTLVTGEDNYKFFSNKPILGKLIANLLVIYAQKAIGLLKVIQWLPYELLGPAESTSNAFSSCYVTYRCVSTIAFSYVKESSKSDDYYELSFYANKFSIAVNIHGASVVNSTPKTYSDNKTATVVAENYNAILPAIASQRRWLLRIYVFFRYRVLRWRIHSDRLSPHSAVRSFADRVINMLFIKAFFFPLIGFFLLFFRSRFSRFSMTCAMRRTASLPASG